MRIDAIDSTACDARVHISTSTVLVLCEGLHDSKPLMTVVSAGRAMSAAVLLVRRDRSACFNAVATVYSDLLETQASATDEGYTQLVAERRLILITDPPGHVFVMVMPFSPGFACAPIDPRYGVLQRVWARRAKPPVSRLPERAVTHVGHGPMPGTVAVVGAGISGLITALFLSEAMPASRITVIDAQRHHSQLTSWGAAAETLFVPPTVMPGLFGTRSKLHIAGKVSHDWWKFGLLRASRPKFNRRSYGRQCLAVFTRVLEQHPSLREFFRDNGVLHVACTKALFARYKKWFGSLNPIERRQYTLLDRAATLELEPTLVTQPFAGCILSKQDGYIQMERFNEALYQLLVEKGVCFRFRQSVVKLVDSGIVVQETDGLGGEYAEQGRVQIAQPLPGVGNTTIQADRVVLCAGVDTVRIASRLASVDLSGQIVGVKGYSVTGTSARGTAHAIVLREYGTFGRSLHGETSYRVGGGVVMPANDLEIDARQIAAVFRESVFGADLLSKQTTKTWAGIRPCPPTDEPLVARIAPRVYVNSGHGANGYVYPWKSSVDLVQLMRRTPS